MLSILLVPDEVVIGFFSAVILGQSAAIIALWIKVDKLTSDAANRQQ